MISIQFVDGSKSKHVQKELSNLCLNLRRSGIFAHWCRSVEDASPGSTLLLHDPVDENSIPEGCRVLGQRTLNRRQRLVLAEKCGLAVPRWRSLEKQDDIVPLFDEWNLDHFLYKADWSYSRGGIRLMTRDNLVWLNKFKPDADVFMEVLDGCPHTFKVDVFFDHVIACRKLLTKSVFDRKFRAGFTGPSTLGEVPAIETKLKTLGRAVFNYGVGLINVDIMIGKDGKAWVIEINTCSVGREATWKRWPGTYITGYAEGITHWVAEGCPAQYWNSHAPDSAKLSDRFGGIHVEQCA